MRKTSLSLLTLAAVAGITITLLENDKTAAKTSMTMLTTTTSLALET